MNLNNEKAERDIFFGIRLLLFCANFHKAIQSRERHFRGQGNKLQFVHFKLSHIDTENVQLWKLTGHFQQEGFAAADFEMKVHLQTKHFLVSKASTEMCQLTNRVRCYGPSYQVPSLALLIPCTESPTQRSLGSGRDGRTQDYSGNCSSQFHQ